MEITKQKPSLALYSKIAQDLKFGAIYEHYKGQRYKVISIARHTETLEELVVYQALYGEKKFWVRPVQMFCEEIEQNGCLVARFRLLESYSAS